MRKEPEAFDISVIRTMGLDPKVYFEKDGVKPVAILTNSQITDNLPQIGNQLYANPRFRKHILTKPSYLSHLIEKTPDVLDRFKKTEI